MNEKQNTRDKSIRVAPGKTKSKPPPSKKFNLLNSLGQSKRPANTRKRKVGILSP